MSPRWAIVVDVGPAPVRERTDRILRDLGFEEAMPCVYVNRWTAPARAELLKRLRLARRGGYGRILVLRLGTRDTVAWIPVRKALP